MGQERSSNREELEFWKLQLKPFGYDVLQLAGKGSYGAVFKAVDKQDDKMVAIKICMKKERGEAEHWPQLHHPHIITLYHTLIINHYYIYIMEFAINGTVGNWAQKNKVDRAVTRKWLWQVIYTVAYLHHNGFYHLDIKLNNLLLDEDMNIKIGDFGKMCFRGEISFHIGAPTYLPPELKKNSFTSIPKFAGPWLEKIDAFSVGACFLRLMTRRTIVDEKIKKNLAVIRDPEIAGILSKLLEKNPNKRYTCKKTKRYKWKFKARRSRVVYACKTCKRWKIISPCISRCCPSSESLDSLRLSALKSSSLTSMSGSFCSSSKYLKQLENAPQGKAFNSSDSFSMKFPKQRIFQYPKFNATFPIVNYLHTQLAIPMLEIGAYSELE